MVNEYYFISYVKQLGERDRYAHEHISKVINKNPFEFMKELNDKFNPWYYVLLEYKEITKEEYEIAKVNDFE